MKPVHISRAPGAEHEFSGAVIVGPQVWADSFRPVAENLPSADPVTDAFDRLETLLARAGSGLANIAKIDAYVSTPEVAERLREVYTTTFEAPRPVLQVQVADVWGPDPVLLDVVAAVHA
jgi:enamine deaminase RidA (YjgF/YER057c/UK114 family)